MIRVIIAEDHQALIDGIESFFFNNDDIDIIATALNGKELVKLVFLYKPDVVITDIRMPIMDGIEATKKIKKRFKKSVHVLAFTMFDQPNAVNQMIDAGALGYILKNSGLKIMIEAIKTVAKGKKYFDPNVLINLEKQKGEQKIQKRGILSRREKEILAQIALGKKSIEIADILYITKHTVDTHRKNIIKKLGLVNNSDLMKIAVERKYKF
jgi:two-component system nitrate/nitrite response regulator NarL